MWLSLVPVLTKTLSHESLIFSQIQYIFSKFLPAKLSLHLVIISGTMKNKWQMPRDSLTKRHARPTGLCPARGARTSCAALPRTLTAGQSQRQETGMVLRCRSWPHDFSLRISARKIPWKCFLICLGPHSRLTNAIYNNRHLLTQVKKKWLIAQPHFYG